MSGAPLGPRTIVLRSAHHVAATNAPAGLLATTPEELDLYYHHPEEYVGGRRCTNPFKMMMVNTDGLVVPAHSRCYNYPVGNVRETSLTQIWNNARCTAFRQVLNQAGGTLPTCTRCCGVIGKKL